MGDERGPLMFCVVNPDGTHSAPKEVSKFEMVEQPPLYGTEVDVCRRPYHQSWHGEVTIRDQDTARELLGDMPLGATQTIVVERCERVWRYRHKYVWQGTRERKGNKANRKVRGHWETVKKRFVIPSTVVTGIDQEFSADAEFPKTTVEFEARACCSKCPMLSYDSRACGLGMGGQNHDEATSMLDRPEWLFDRRPGWCGLHGKGEKCG